MYYYKFLLVRLLRSVHSYVRHKPFLFILLHLHSLSLASLASYSDTEKLHFLDVLALTSLDVLNPASPFLSVGSLLGTWNS